MFIFFYGKLSLFTKAPVCNVFFVDLEFSSLDFIILLKWLYNNLSLSHDGLKLKKILMKDEIIFIAKRVAKRGREYFIPL